MNCGEVLKKNTTRTSFICRSFNWTSFTNQIQSQPKKSHTCDKNRRILVVFSTISFFSTLYLNVIFNSLYTDYYQCTHKTFFRNTHNWHSFTAQVMYDTGVSMKSKHSLALSFVLQLNFRYLIIHTHTHNVLIQHKQMSLHNTLLKFAHCTCSVNVYSFLPIWSTWLLFLLVFLLLFSLQFLVCLHTVCQFMCVLR